MPSSHDDRVTRRVAGNPTQAETAAVLLAVDRVVWEQAAVPPSSRSAWRRAARLEALGGAPASSPRDLDARR